MTKVRLAVFTVMALLLFVLVAPMRLVALRLLLPAVLVIIGVSLIRSIIKIYREEQPCQEESNASPTTSPKKSSPKKAKETP